MVRLYGQPLAILVVCKTRWSSLQMCIASPLQVHGALRSFFVELGDSAPPALLPLREGFFWTQLVVAEAVIHPVDQTAFLLERDKSSLADVFWAYESVYQHLSEAVVHTGVSGLCTDLQRHWQSEEHPLFLVAWLLLPDYMTAARSLLDLDWRGTPMSYFTSFNIASAAGGYFRKWFPGEEIAASRVMQQLFDFLTEGEVQPSHFPVVSGSNMIRTEKCLVWP